MEKICSHKRVSQIITGDPVRPHINAETRLAPGRDVFHMDGIDFTSRAKKMHLDIAKRKLKRGKLKLKRAHGKDMLAQAS